MTAQTPRNIILIDEFENAMKGKYGAVSFGVKEGDIFLVNWHGSIVTTKGDIYEFTFVCYENFPATAPEIQFDKKMIKDNKLMKICNSDNTLKKEVLDKLSWGNNYSIGEYFVKIKNLLDC